jgi:hypothetical protein
MTWDGQLGSHFALVVASHAVGQHHDQGVRGVGIGHAVFVVGAAAAAAGLIDDVFHSSLVSLSLISANSVGFWLAGGLGHGDEPFLHREHALGSFRVTELQHGLDQFQQTLRIQAGVGPGHRGELVLLHPLVGGRRRHLGDAGVHGGADAVDIRPRSEPVALAVLLGGGETRRVHGRCGQHVLAERLAGRAEIDEHRGAVGADVDVGGLDVQMQDLVGMNLAQAIEQLDEHAAQEGLAHGLLQPGDMPLQGFSLLVLHHHVDRVVGAEEIHHLHHVGVADPGQGAAPRRRSISCRSERKPPFRWRWAPPSPVRRA